MPHFAEAAAMIGLSAAGVVVTNLAPAGTGGSVWVVGVTAGRWSTAIPVVWGAGGAAGWGVGCGATGAGAANASGNGLSLELTTTTVVWPTLVGAFTTMLGAGGPYWTSVAGAGSGPAAALPGAMAVIMSEARPRTSARNKGELPGPRWLRSMPARLLL